MRNFDFVIKKKKKEEIDTHFRAKKEKFLNQTTCDK